MSSAPASWRPEPVRAQRWLDEGLAATATAAALAAIAVQIGWFWRGEAEEVVAVGACAALGILALASPTAQFADAARLTGFASLALSVPSALLLLAAAPVPDGVVRIAGMDAVATSVAVSAEVFDQADVAVVALATEEHHALLAGSLAASSGSPLLLTSEGEVRSDVLSELSRLGANRVVIVAAGAGRDIERQLARLGFGADRLSGTAIEIAATISRVGPTSPPWLVSDAIDEDGSVRPSIPEAIIRGARVLLVEHGGVPLLTARALLDAEPGALVLDVDRPADIRRVLRDVLGPTPVARGFGAAATEPSGHWVAAAGSPLDVAVSAAAAAKTGGDVVMVRPGQRPILLGSGSIVVVGGTGAVPDGLVRGERAS